MPTAEAETKIARSKDKSLAEWLRDKELARGSVLNGCAAELRALARTDHVKDELVVPDDWREREPFEADDLLALEQLVALGVEVGLVDDGEADYSWDIIYTFGIKDAGVSSDYLEEIGWQYSFDIT